MYVKHPIQGYMLCEPEKAKQFLKQSYVDARGNRKAAASFLECDPVTFWRWGKKLGLTAWFDAVEEIAKRDGWHWSTVGPGKRSSTQRSSSVPEQRPGR